MLFRASEGRGFSLVVPTPEPQIVENVGARFAAGLKAPPFRSQVRQLKDAILRGKTFKSFVFNKMMGYPCWLLLRSLSFQ